MQDLGGFAQILQFSHISQLRSFQGRRAETRLCTKGRQRNAAGALLEMRNESEAIEPKFENRQPTAPAERKTGMVGCGKGRKKTQEPRPGSGSESLIRFVGGTPHQLRGSHPSPSCRSPARRRVPPKCVGGCSTAHLLGCRTGEDLAGPSW